MTQEQKEALFRLLARATDARNDADPLSDDTWAFAFYQGVDDAVCTLGLLNEYNKWSEAQK